MLMEDDFVNVDHQGQYGVHIETLPPEIRLQVLYLIEIEGLRSPVRSSPVYHQQFLLDCKRLLLQCLENTPGVVTVDACIVHQSDI
jgi:hypothetical protein